MKETKNYSFKKPNVKEFFELQTWNDNLDKIDQEIKNRELAQNESNEQIGKMKKISFDEQEEPKELVNGETVKSAFGKLAAAVKTLIIHKTLQATDAVLGHVKLSNSAAITEKGLYALDAVEKNATVDGTLAKKISELNDGLANKYFLKVLAKDWSGFVGTLFPQFNVQNDNVVDIYADKTDGTYPAVRVGRAYADHDGNDIPTTYLKKSDINMYEILKLRGYIDNANWQTWPGVYKTGPETTDAPGYGALLVIGTSANGFTGSDWYFQVHFGTDGLIRTRRSINATGGGGWTAWEVISKS